MIDQANVVVIGGGITGCSVLYHLARAGWADCVLVEKGELTSGATCQAAGMLTQFNMSPTIMRMRKYSVSLYKELGAYGEVGSVNIAATPEMLKTLQRNVSRARGIGLDVGIISPQETLRLLPWASADNFYGAVHIPGDGHIDPHETTYAVAKAARGLGAEILVHTRVTAIRLNSRGGIAGVATDRGDIACDIVVNAAGIWTAQVAAMAGARVPCTPVIHQHIAMETVADSKIPMDSPTFRDYEYLIYGRPEGGSYLIGGWEANPEACWIDGVPWQHESAEVPSDLDRFAPMLEDAMGRFPFLAEAGIIRLVAHPDAFTPDAGPLLGPWPGVRGLWFAAASSMQGFGGGGGMGKCIAEWITAGETEWDIFAYRPWRFGPNYLDPSYAAECARECYKYYYRTCYPHDEDVAMRPRRISAFHHRMQDLNAVFGKKNGWERVNYFETNKPWRRAGEDQRKWGGWTRPAFFDAVAGEVAAVRKQAGIFDLSSFGKIELTGPGALPLVQRVTDNDVNRPVGNVIYSQFLNSQGGIVGDVLVTRLGEDHFRIVTGAGLIDGDLGWLQLNRKADDPAVEIRDVTDGYSVIGLWGPEARKVFSFVTDHDLSSGAFPYMTAQSFAIDGIPVLAQRVTYVGELGWEIYIPTDRAVLIWDRLWAAGLDVGLRACGYKAIDSLRLEKGYLALAGDITALETPYEAGLDFCVKMGDSNPFIGREALQAAREKGFSQQMCTLVIGDKQDLTLYGGEAVSSEDRVVSRLRSAGYGHHVKKNIGFAYLPSELTQEGTELHVDIFGQSVPARVTARVLYDPNGTAIRCAETR